MDSALIWSTIGLVIATAGLAVATVVTFREFSLSIFRKNLLQITTKDGRLVVIINIDKIDQEDPEKIKQALEDVRKAKQEAVAS
jgi:hypothetical protein